MIALALFLLGCIGQAGGDKPGQEANVSKNITQNITAPENNTTPPEQPDCGAPELQKQIADACTAKGGRVYILETCPYRIECIIPENLTPDVPAEPGVQKKENETAEKTENKTGGTEGEMEFVRCPSERYDICTQEYEPVCGEVYTDKGYYWREYPNGCTACSKGANAILYKKGTC